MDYCSCMLAIQARGSKSESHEESLKAGLRGDTRDRGREIRGWVRSMEQKRAEMTDLSMV